MGLSCISYWGLRHSFLFSVTVAPVKPSSSSARRRSSIFGFFQRRYTSEVMWWLWSQVALLIALCGGTYSDVRGLPVAHQQACCECRGQWDECQRPLLYISHSSASRRLQIFSGKANLFSCSTPGCSLRLPKQRGNSITKYLLCDCITLSNLILCVVPIEETWTWSRE